MNTFTLNNYSLDSKDRIYKTGFYRKEARIIVDQAQRLSAIENINQEALVSSCQNTALASANLSLITHIFLKAISLATAGLGALGYSIYNIAKAQKLSAERQMLKQVLRYEMGNEDQFFSKLQQAAKEILPLVELERNEKIATAFFSALTAVALITLFSVGAYTQVHRSLPALLKEVGSGSVLVATTSITCWIGKNILFSYLKQRDSTLKAAKNALECIEELKALFPSPKKILENLSAYHSEKIVLHIADNLFYLKKNSLVKEPSTLTNWSSKSDWITYEIK